MGRRNHHVTPRHDARIHRTFELSCEVKGHAGAWRAWACPALRRGRGHIQRIKEAVRKDAV